MNKRIKEDVSSKGNFLIKKRARFDVLFFFWLHNLFFCIMLPQINRYHSGSTDLKEGQIIEQWAEADPEYQISKGKYSLAAKISMDEAALKFGEDHPDIRIVIFNPSMIVGPMFHPDMHGSLAFFKDILSQGDQLKEVPDDSMSFIDVRDLAQLELAALENKNAKGM